MALKDWKKVRGGWKSGLTRLYINEVELDNGKILYGVSIVDDEGWTSQKYRNVPIVSTTSKKKLLAQIKSYMKNN